jgi:hypothetical protein
MSDHADISDKGIFAAVIRGLDAIRRQPELIADLRCHFCDDKIEPCHLFCNTDCRDDYEKEEAGLFRSGKYCSYK